MAKKIKIKRQKIKNVAKNDGKSQGKKNGQ